jgi:uncharacterized protein
MSDAKPQSEPSMEEILATISHIIAEDRPSGGAGGPEEVVDLTDAVGDDGTVRHLAPQSDAAPGAAAGNADRILSPASSGAAAAALAQLASAASQRQRAGDLPIGSSGRSLEDLVREMLRPMLQSWLDQHLAGLVERLVREEIARVAGEAGLR